MNIKIVLIAFSLISTSLFAQVEEESIKKERTESDVTLTSSRMYLEFGAVRPSYFGNNVSGVAYDFETGIYVGIAAYISKEWGLRLGYDATDYSNLDTSIAGLFPNGTLSHIKFQIFYELPVSEKFFARANGGVASVRYKNKAKENKQIDTGVAAALDLTVSYSPFHFLEIYFNTGLYIESLDIKAPPIQQDFFDNAIGLYPALGIRIKT